MKKGFTLMEIMVVIAIMGVLAIMVLGNYKATMRKKNDLKRKSDLSQIGKALELYYQDFGHFPYEGGGANIGKIQGCGATGTDDCTWGTSIFSQGAGATQVIYMPKLPADPTSSKTYYYETDSNGSYYKIYAQLENTDDPDYHQYGVSAATTPSCSSVIPPICTFGVASTNTSVQYNTH